MPIALPLMFPFAEAAGITLTGLGIAKATDVIMNYIQANPEKSKQILSTLSPLIGGMGSILTNKKSKDLLFPEEETIETTPEQQPRLTGKEKGQRIKDAIRRAREGKGNYSSPDAEGPAVDIRGSVIREVEDMGMASKKRKPVNPNPEEDETEYSGPSLTEEFRQLGRDRGSTEDFRELARLAKKIREGKADGGRIGYAPGGVATTQDYANALQRVGAGTAEQKRTSVNDYAQNEAYGLLNNAMSSQSGLTDLYNNYIKGQGGLGSNAFGFGRDAATSQTASTFDPKYKQQVLDQIAYKIQQETPYKKTYPWENASRQELMPAGTVGSKNFESNITTPQEAAALARYMALQSGTDMEQYDAEQAASGAGTLDDFYRNLGLQNSTLMDQNSEGTIGVPFAMGGPVSMTKNGVATLFSRKR